MVTRILKYWQTFKQFHKIIGMTWAGKYRTKEIKPAFYVEAFLWNLPKNTFSKPFVLYLRETGMQPCHL